MPADGGDLSFWAFYDTEPDWDHLFVEARTAGPTTGRRCPTPTATRRRTPAQSCPGGLAHAAPAARALPDRGGHEHLHPDRHVRRVERGVGQLGRLAAVAGRPRAYAGQPVEVSISYVERPGHAGARRLRRRRHVPDGTSTSFETGLDGWAAPGLPPAARGERERLDAIDAASFPEGAVVATDDSLFMGFGFEGISTAASRNEIMGRATGYLLR